MKQTIIGISGRKGSGKNTLATSISQECLRRFGKTPFECSFADTLKQFCMETLGLSREQCYGTDDQKNSPTKYYWEDVEIYFRWKFGDRKFKNLSDNSEFSLEKDSINRLTFYKTLLDYEPVNIKCGKMSARDILQLFGTELVRETFGNVWAEATLRRIKTQGQWLSLITDVRFDNEVDAVLKQEFGYVIRLTRSPFGTKDTHASEAALDNFDWNKDKCFVLDNRDLSVEEQNVKAKPIWEAIIGTT